MSAIKGFLNEVKTAKILRLGFCHALLLMFGLAAAPAQAQSVRTWVSGAGSDASPDCSRAVPCATFQIAHGKTAAGGEINCLDSGSFSSVTITKSITINCEGVIGAVVADNLTNVAIVVTAGSTDVVVLRGLDIFGNFSGIAGVSFAFGAALHIENCWIHDFNLFVGFGTVPGWGITAGSSNSGELYVTNTTISHNGSATDGGGIKITAPPGTTQKVTINQSNVQNNTTGIKADGASGAGGVINMTIRDTASVGNTQNGIVGTTNASGAAIVMMVDRVAASYNAAGYGIVADGPNTFIRFGGSSIAGNAYGVGALNGATLRSFGTNQIEGNSIDGTPVIISLK